MLNNSDRSVFSVYGYSLIEMLIVTAIIVILATVPIALVRRSREKIMEAEAVRALGIMAIAYENYYSLNQHAYPNYRSDGLLTKDIKFTDAEDIWDELIYQSLLPRQYSGFPHNKKDLMARGYVMSIYPVDYGGTTGAVKETYAIALYPYKGSLARRPLGIFQGPRFFSNYASAVPRKLGAFGPYSTAIYSLTD